MKKFKKCNEENNNKMSNTLVHLHTDIVIIKGKFKDKNGHELILTGTEWGYFLQGENIVKMVYTQKQAIDFIEKHEFNTKIIEPLYYWINNENQ